MTDKLRITTGRYHKTRSFTIGTSILIAILIEIILKMANNEGTYG